MYYYYYYYYYYSNYWVSVYLCLVYVKSFHYFMLW
jgi:hypothetical protein